MYNGMKKYVYSQLVTIPSKNGKNGKVQSYIVGAGYYPELTLDSLENIVRAVGQYYELYGKDVAMKEINQFPSKFLSGELMIMALDMDGKCIANSRDPQFIGKNFMQQKTSSGHSLKNFLGYMAKGHNWIYAWGANNMVAMYGTKTGEGKDAFFVMSQLFPFKKRDICRFMVGKTIQFMNIWGLRKTFNELINPDGQFVVGDMYVSVYDFKGTCLIHGIDKSVIWHNFLDAQDATGQFFIQKMIAKAQYGEGWVSFAARNSKRITYVAGITPDNNPDFFMKEKLFTTPFFVEVGYYK